MRVKSDEEALLSVLSTKHLKIITAHHIKYIHCISSTNTRHSTKGLGKFPSDTVFLYFAEKFELTDPFSLFSAILHGILLSPE